MPELQIDPTRFHGETRAPVMIAEGPQGELARVAGLADPQWLRAQVLAGQRGDLGVRGPVRLVTEPDLIDELKGRLAELGSDGTARQGRGSLLAACRLRGPAGGGENPRAQDRPHRGRQRRRARRAGQPHRRGRDPDQPARPACPSPSAWSCSTPTDPAQVATAQRLGQQARPGQRGDLSGHRLGPARRLGGLASRWRTPRCTGVSADRRCARPLRPGAGAGAGRGQATGCSPSPSIPPQEAP